MFLRRRCFIIKMPIIIIVIFISKCIVTGGVKPITVDLAKQRAEKIKAHKGAGRSLTDAPVGILGRPMHLGMLYDMRTDTLILGANMLNENQPPPNCIIRVEPVLEIKDELTVTDTLKKKCDLLDIGGSLGGGIAVGSATITFEGGFGIVHDEKKLSRLSRMIASKRIRTISKSLSLDCLRFLSQTSLFEKFKKYATHVVSSVTYGASIHFVFDTIVSSKNESNKMSGYIQGELEMKGGINAKARINITAETEAVKLMKQTNVKFHGDVFLPINPVTVDHAIKLLQTISESLDPEPFDPSDLPEKKRKRRQDSQEGSIKPKAVPVIAALTPLSELDTSAAAMVREADQKHIDKAFSVFDEFTQMSMFGNDILSMASKHGFFPARKIVCEIQDYVFVFRSVLQSKMAKEIIKIRSGESMSSDLVTNVYQPFLLSPFRTLVLGYFIQDLYKHCEILAQPPLHMMKSKRPILPARQAVVLIRALVSFQYLLVYKYQEMTSDQPFLEALNNHVNKRESPLAVANGTNYAPYRRHFFNRSRSALASRLVHFININEKSPNIGSLYFTKDIEWEKTDHPEPSIYLYENARLVDRDYQIPSKVVSITCLHREHDSLEIGWERSLYASANVISYEVIYFLIIPKRASTTNKTEPRIVGTVNTNDNYTKLENLSPNVNVQVNVTPIALPGRCEVSHTLSTCWSRPSSRPSQPFLKAAGPTSLVVAWYAPAIISPSAKFQHYLIEYRQADEDAALPMKQIVPADILAQIVHTNISYLTANLAYTFRATAVFQTDSSLPGKWSAPLQTGLMCGKGWNISHDGAHCYFLSHGRTYAKSWLHAMEDCGTRGSPRTRPMLVTLLNNEETYLVEEVASLAASDYVPFWVGLTYINGSWLWVADEFDMSEGPASLKRRRLKDVSIARFARGTNYKEPGDQGCVYVDQDLQWRLDWCDGRATGKHYICKKKIEKPDFCEK